MSLQEKLEKALSSTVLADEDSHFAVGDKELYVSVQDHDPAEDITIDDDPIFGEQVQQEAKFQAWVQDPHNAKLIHDLKSTWFAWKDGKIIAQADSFDGINKAVVALKIRPIDTYRNSTSEPSYQPLKLSIPRREGSVVEHEFRLDFCNVRGADPRYTVTVVLTLDTGADSSSFPPDKILAKFRSWSMECIQNKKEGKAMIPCFGDFALLERDKAVIKKMAAQCWAQIVDSPHWILIPFTVNTNLEKTYQNLFGREAALDVLSFRWVGDLAKNLTTGEPYQNNARGFIQFDSY